MIVSTLLRPWLASVLVLTLIAISGAAFANAPDSEALGTDAKAVEATTPEPVIELNPVKASYRASIDKGVAISGNAVRLLEPQADGTWLYRFNVDSFLADIEESLHFRWQNNRVIPLRYRYKLSGFMIGGRERAIDYDWNNNTASGHFRGDRFTVDLKDGVLDPLGYQLQLMQDIKAGKTDMLYTVTDKDQYEEDQFAVIGKEPLNTALGRLNTIKAEKVRAPDRKRQTLMWFAPELDYLLVKLVQVESDGTRYEINIKDADIGR